METNQSIQGLLLSCNFFKHKRIHEIPYHYIHWSEVILSLSISLIVDTILLIWGDAANTSNYPMNGTGWLTNMKIPIVYLYVSTGSGLGVKNPLNDSGKQPGDHPGGHPTSTGRKQPGGYPNRFRRLRSNKCWPPTKKHAGGLNWIWKMWQINSTTDLSWFVGNFFWNLDYDLWEIQY